MELCNRIRTETKRARVQMFPCDDTLSLRRTNRSRKHYITDSWARAPFAQNLRRTQTKAAPTESKHKTRHTYQRSTTVDSRSRSGPACRAAANSKVRWPDVRSATSASFTRSSARPRIEIPPRRGESLYQSLTGNRLVPLASLCSRKN